MKTPKDLRLLSAALIVCALILSVGLLRHRKAETDRQNLVEAEEYVTQTQRGTSASSIEIWLKRRDFVCAREENNAANPYAYSMFTDAKVSPRNIAFYLMSWSENEPHSFNNPRHSFVFFFDRQQKLVNATTLRIPARGVSF